MATPQQSVKSWILRTQTDRVFPMYLSFLYGERKITAVRSDAVRFATEGDALDVKAFVNARAGRWQGPFVVEEYLGA